MEKQVTGSGITTKSASCPTLAYCTAYRSTTIKWWRKQVHVLKIYVMFTMRSSGIVVPQIIFKYNALNRISAPDSKSKQNQCKSDSIDRRFTTSKKEKNNIYTNERSSSSNELRNSREHHDLKCLFRTFWSKRFVNLRIFRLNDWAPNIQKQESEATHEMRKWYEIKISETITHEKKEKWRGEYKGVDLCRRLSGQNSSTAIANHNITSDGVPLRFHRPMYKHTDPRRNRSN